MMVLVVNGIVLGDCQLQVSAVSPQPFALVGAGPWGRRRFRRGGLDESRLRGLLFVDSTLEESRSLVML